MYIVANLENLKNMSKLASVYYTFSFGPKYSLVNIIQTYFKHKVSFVYLGNSYRNVLLKNKN